MGPTRAKIEIFLRGIKQVEIAKKAGVDVAFVNRCINGKQKPSRKILRAVEELTGVNVFEKEEVK